MRTRVRAELEKLQEEFTSQEDFIEVVTAATFGFSEEPEDRDNMSIEILAEVSSSLSSSRLSVYLSRTYPYTNVLTRKRTDAADGRTR